MTERVPTNIFDIVTSRDFLDKLKADYADFKSQPSSARLALNFIITAYHLHDWVWGDWLKADYATRKKLGIRKMPSFKAWLDRSCPGFGALKDLTNGAKHLRKTNVATEFIDGGFGSGPYGIGPLAQPYLLIDDGADGEQRWQTAGELLDQAIAFWDDFFKEYRP
jgi:hypothetical protein